MSSVGSRGSSSGNASTALTLWSWFCLSNGLSFTQQLLFKSYISTGADNFHCLGRGMSRSSRRGYRVKPRGEMSLRISVGCAECLAGLLCSEYVETRENELQSLVRFVRFSSILDFSWGSPSRWRSSSCCFHFFTRILYFSLPTAATYSYWRFSAGGIAFHRAATVRAKFLKSIFPWLFFGFLPESGAGSDLSNTPLWSRKNRL